MSTSSITASILRARLSYNADTGVFVWNVGEKRAGRVAGRGKPPKGYWVIEIDGTRYYAHRLAWLYVHGEWPAAQIDHKDRDRTNNRISNLRLATDTQNRANSGKYANNTSGLKGVSWDRARQKWIAQITKDGNFHYLGRFDSKEAAHAAYRAAASSLFGEFACVG